MTEGLQQPTSTTGYVLVVGAANLDILSAAQSLLTMGDSNLGRIRCTPGGVARNTAENLARLGHTTRLIAAVGDDAFGRNLLDVTRAAGVDIQLCAVLTEHATSTYLSVHHSQGEMAVAVNDMGIVDAITPEFLAAHTAVIKQASAVVVDCNLPADTLAWLLSQSKAPVFVDAVSAAKCLRIRPHLRGIHTLKLNQIEAQKLTGLPCESPADIQAAAAWLYGEGVRQILVSLGERGMLWSDMQAGQGLQAALPCKVVNVTGAGDALLAGWVHAFMHRQPLADAARFAQACAALTVGSESANHPGLSVTAVTHLLHPAP
jgi:pseudouridine kinase